MAKRLSANENHNQSTTKDHSEITGTDYLQADGTFKRGLDVNITGSSKGNELFLWDDTTTADTIYMGSASPGSATSASVWRISKVDLTTKSITYADLNENNDNIWDDRSILTYG